MVCYTHQDKFETRHEIIRRAVTHAWEETKADTAVECDARQKTWEQIQGSEADPSEGKVTQRPHAEINILASMEISTDGTGRCQMNKRSTVLVIVGIK